MRKFATTMCSLTLAVACAFQVAPQASALDRYDFDDFGSSLEQEPPTEGSLSSELTYEELTALRFGSTDDAAAENCAEKLDLGEGPWPDMYLTRDCSEIEIEPLDYL
ncbi:hypothetical protein [Corynebacterium argentoratense]